MRALLTEAKAAYRARNALPLLVESDLQLARWLAGLHGADVRREVSELVFSMVEAGTMLPLVEDQLLTLIEAAQVRGGPKPLTPISTSCRCR